MENFVVKISNELMTQQAVEEIVSSNEKTINYGLKLTVEEAKILLVTKNQSLKNNGRVEFGGIIIKKIIEAFCDSPYISQYNYVDTIDELINIFYYYKNETLDYISDDELIEIMKNFFDGSCQGSLELLENRELYKVEKNIKNGVKDYLNIETDKDDICDYEIEDEDYYS